MNPQQKINELSQEYTVDKTELGKIMVIASATLLLFSIHTTLTLQNTKEKATKLDERLDKAYTLINSQRFNNSLNALEDTKGTKIGPMYLGAAKAFRKAQNATKTAEQLQEELKARSQAYQWNILVSLLGIVAGALIIYM